RRDRRHTGLGLSIVRAIVAGYGGTVTGANGEEGGAVFEVRLKAAGG
ncbi:MAG TPA: ATP-binding protein, partial [Thermoanaerobaculia bacterium]|nr:ATP-binding protein [Thermoanaerobaculia bacterium]